MYPLLRCRVRLILLSIRGVRFSFLQQMFSFAKYCFCLCIQAAWLFSEKENPLHLHCFAQMRMLQSLIWSE